MVDWSLLFTRDEFHSTLQLLQNSISFSAKETWKNLEIKVLENKTYARASVLPLDEETPNRAISNSHLTVMCTRNVYLPCWPRSSRKRKIQPHRRSAVCQKEALFSNKIGQNYNKPTYPRKWGIQILKITSKQSGHESWKCMKEWNILFGKMLWWNNKTEKIWLFYSSSGPNLCCFRLRYQRYSCCFVLWGWNASYLREKVFG